MSDTKNKSESGATSATNATGAAPTVTTAPTTVVSAPLRGAQIVYVSLQDEVDQFAYLTAKPIKTNRMTPSIAAHTAYGPLFLAIINHS